MTYTSGHKKIMIQKSDSLGTIRALTLLKCGADL